MDEDELLSKIKWLNNPLGGNVKQRILSEEFFIEQPEYSDLKRAFKLSKYHERGWKWHQLVRIVLEPKEDRQYMYDRLLHLLLKHRRSYEDYFELRTEEGTYRIPNPVADLNRLEILYKKYFQIYRSITGQIHFDYPKKEYIGPHIIGKINWGKTLVNSTTQFPIDFVTTIQKKEFETPENILLLLCAEWMYRESNRLLQIEFVEPLSEDKRSLLLTIMNKSKMILDHFPLATVLNSSKRFWNLSYNDSRIRSLEENTRQRLRQKLIHNPSYRSLLEWIEEFRELNILSVTEKTPTKHILDSIENLDTVYEAWIFLEFVDYLYEKGLLVNFQLGEIPKCEFEYNGVVVTLWYEREFNKGGSHAWVVTSVPDFTAMVDDEIIAIFDAKNYAKTSSLTDTQNKMLAYMTNLDTNFGALIYPNYPKFWDDLDKAQKIEELKPALNKEFPEKTEWEIEKMAKGEARLFWHELPQEHQSILPPRAVGTLEYPGKRWKAKYHFDLTLALIRLSPLSTDFAIKMKKDALDFIFQAIVRRIPLTLKS